MRIAIPDPSLVALVGASGSGKSTFAARHFLPTETVSSDACRGLVADDPNDQSATEPAFSGEYVHSEADGTYHCAACGAISFPELSTGLRPIGGEKHGVVDANEL